MTTVPRGPLLISYSLAAISVSITLQRCGDGKRRRPRVLDPMLAVNFVAFRVSTLAFCLVAASASAVLAAQLPPDVQADRLWLRAERHIGNGEYWSALASLDEILGLQAEHDVAIPESFWFSHAVASHRAGLHSQAAASATRYVESAGREGDAISRPLSC